MPRDPGTGIYTLPPGTTAVPIQPIKSTDYNAVISDIAQTLNTAQPVSAGGTGATNPTVARQNLGVAIGTNVQAFDAALQSISVLTTAADRMIYTTAADVYAVATLTAYARALLDDVDAAAMRTTLGLVLGTNAQAYDAGLQSIAGLTTAADRMIYTTASDAYATTALTPFARSVLDDGDAATARATLGANNAANLTTGTLPDARLAGSYSFTGLTLDDVLYVKNRVDVTVPAGSVPEVRLTRNGVRVASLYYDTSDNLVLRRFHPTSGAGEGYLRLDGNGVNDVLYNGFKMWHEGNDGAGSGLDADVLDGQQGTYYRDLANATGTLPSGRLSGDYAFGMLSLTTRLQISGLSPEIKFLDTTSGEYSARLRVNANNVYFDSSTDDVNFGEVFRFELDAKRGYIAGAQILTNTDLTASYIAGKLGYTPAGIYTGSDSSNANYPLGTYLFVIRDGGAYTSLNGARALRVYNDNCIVTSTGGTGPNLAGTWRHRGDTNDGGGSTGLYQRVA